MATPGAIEDLDRLLILPLTNHVAERQVSRRDLLEKVLKQAESPCSVETLIQILEAAGVDATRTYPTIAWMLKYDLLRLEI